jgi:hypothetical protein
MHMFWSESVLVTDARRILKWDVVIWKWAGCCSDGHMFRRC